MNDLFGREVKRGDVVVYGYYKLVSGFAKYAESRLGVVSKVVPKITHIRGSSMWKKLLKDSLKGISINDPRLPDTVDTFEKIVFYPLFNGDTKLNLSLGTIRKNGKPKRSVILTTSALVIDKDSLSDDWKQVYLDTCQAFKI